MTRSFLQIFAIVAIAFAAAYSDEPQGAATEDAISELKSTINPKKLAEQPMSVWMERKLDYSQAIFKALAMGDMDSVKVKAAQMNLIGKVEGFARMKNRPYQAQLHTFDRVSHELATQADKGNVEGVTLAFNQLTVNCVQCHQLLRADAAKDL